MKRSRNGARRVSMNAAYGPEPDADVRAYLSDPDFLEDKLVVDYLAGELSEMERAQFDERVQGDTAFRARAESLQAIWNIRRPGETPKEPDIGDRHDAQRVWLKLKQRIELEEQGVHTLTLAEKRARRRNTRRFFFGVVAMLMTWYLALRFWPERVPAPGMLVRVDAPSTAERTERLPDGTVVTLVPGSHLTYFRWFATSDERTLNLEGQATFTLAPGLHRPLTVGGAAVEVKASEGRFTVHSYNTETIAYVEVHEGSATVQPRTVYAKGELVTLHADESVAVGPGLQTNRLTALRLHR